MRPKLSLAARAFLLGFFPICVILAGIFFTINASVRAQLKTGLKESMRRTEKALDVANADYNRRNSELLAAATEDSGLKASIGLLREKPYGQKPDPQVLKIVNDQLAEVARGADYDFLLFSDADGNPVTGFTGRTAPDRAPLDATAINLDLFPLIKLNGKLYEGTAVPVNLGPENLGNLILGREFNLAPLNSTGFAAVLHDRKILRTNFPQQAATEVEKLLAKSCSTQQDDCEIRAAGEDYLAVRAQRARFGDAIQLFTFQSIDAATNQFMGPFRKDFLLIGLAGMLVFLLISALTSRSLSQPLTDLIAHLNRSERMGRIRADFSVQSPVTEVNRLAEAFNRAADHLEKTSLEFVETMAQALDARDPYTAGHSNRVSVNSTTVAEAMGLSADEVQIIRIGAKLHDIGKIGIPDAVLQKPGALTQQEYALIKLHPQIGKRILEKAGSFQEYLPIVELHHEDQDGGGYPYGLKGDSIPLGVRIVHVADVYDAITSHRAYRKAMPEEQVMRILREGSGTKFDPAVLEVFLEILRQRKVLEMVLDQVGDQAGVAHVPV